MALAEVRATTPADAAVLAELQLTYWQQAYATVLPAELLQRSPAEHALAWQTQLADGGPALLATEGGQPVGFAVVADLVDDVTGLVEAIGVLPRWSRRGHGGRLLAEAAGLLRNRGAARGRYWVPDADVIMAAFFRTAGWSPDGPRRVLDTGEGQLAESSYLGHLDLVLG